MNEHEENVKTVRCSERPSTQNAKLSTSSGTTENLSRYHLENVSHSFTQTVNKLCKERETIRKQSPCEKKTMTVLFNHIC